MTLSRFADLKPLPSHLVGRTLALGRDHLPGKRGLQAKAAELAAERGEAI